MKALVLARYGGPREAFELRELPTPEPAQGQVRIAVEAFGLNYADISARQGTYQDAPPIPCVIGYEVVGRIDAVGAGVSGLSSGQRVAALTRFGGYATSAVTDARAAVVIPEDMDLGVAAALPTQGCTAYYCAEEMVRLHPGDHVLIQAAAGGVGTLLVQLCKRRGCVVYGTAGSDRKLDYLRELGVDHPINYQREDFAEAVRRIRGGAGLDVVFDSLGGSAVRKGLALLAAGGRIVCFGAAEREAGALQIVKDVRFALSFGFIHPIPLLMKSKAIIGVNMLHVSDERPEALKRAIDGIAELALNGEIKPTIGGRFKAEQIAEAHELLGGRGSIGKVVVSW
ncbi:MAG TPA: zinc-binding dehydrogenase [Candidatus Acidoferrales bacterium]|nr:zinc-binding dehydrogenase [Candidatus Acidoferrales bacterium]